MLMHSGTFVIVCIVSLIRWVRNDYQNQTPLTLTQTGLQRSYARTPRGNGEEAVEEGNGGGSVERFQSLFVVPPTPLAGMESSDNHDELYFLDVRKDAICKTTCD